MTGREVREIRLRSGCTQRAFAEKLGVRENSVARWERGEIGMRNTTVRLIRLLFAGAVLDSTPAQRPAGRVDPEA
jgi:transcriptional regulator with XRE-family HTH domain